MDVFAYHDYRKCLKQALEAKRQLDTRWNTSWFARRAQIQRTYLSHVLAGRAELNADQLFRLCRCMQMRDEEEEYLQILLAIARCDVAERRERLQTQRDRLQRGARATERFVPAGKRATADMERYYADPLLPMAHMLLLVPEFAAEPRRVAQRLGVSDDRLQSMLTTLSELGILQPGEGGYRVSEANVHLPHAHPLARLHAASMRQWSAQRRVVSDDPNNFFFTATIACDESARQAIRQVLLDAVKMTSAAVADAPAQEVFQLNLDLFQV